MNVYLTICVVFLLYFPILDFIRIFNTLHFYPQSLFKTPAVFKKQRKILAWPWPKYRKCGPTTTTWAWRAGMPDGNVWFWILTFAKLVNYCKCHASNLMGTHYKAIEYKTKA